MNFELPRLQGSSMRYDECAERSPQRLFGPEASFSDLWDNLVPETAVHAHQLLSPTKQPGHKHEPGPAKGDPPGAIRKLQELAFPICGPKSNATSVMGNPEIWCELSPRSNMNDRDTFLRHVRAECCDRNFGSCQTDACMLYHISCTARGASL